MANSIVKFYDFAERPPRGGWGGAWVRNIEYHGHSESAVIDAVRVDWINNGTYRDDDEIRAELWRYWCAREPERCRQPGQAAAGFTTTASPAADGSQTANWKSAEGPRLWAKLHYFGYALHRQGSIEPMDVRRWLEIFRREIACEDCRSNWSLEVALLPPALNTATAFFEWTVAVHNSINARIGKPQFPLAEAYNLYSK